MEFTTSRFKHRKKIFIQFKILFESNDIGLNGEKNKSYLLYTFPIDADKRTIYGNLGEPRVITQENEFNLTQSSKSYNNDIIFSDDKVIAFDGFVHISAKLSTAQGKKVKIYSTLGFKIDPGAKISPDIELIIGYPFTKIPQPPATNQQIANFCANTNQYKAQNFSAAAIRREKEEYDRRKQQKEEREKLAALAPNPFTLFPNPNTGTFHIKFERELNNSVHLNLYDITGRVLYSQTLDKGHTNFSIQTDNFADGIYFATITQGDYKKTEKVMIQRN